MSDNLENRKRWTVARGELVKLNLRQCECGRVWVPELQASKASGVVSGWYDDVASVRSAFEEDTNIDAVIRISTTDRGRIKCPNCQ